jgi:hypothetical protein
MLELAKSLPPSQLAQKAYALYAKFRPEIPPGKKGQGASGKLELDLIRKMASAWPQGAFVLPYTRCDKKGRVRRPNPGFTHKIWKVVYDKSCWFASEREGNVSDQRRLSASRWSDPFDPFTKDDFLFLGPRHRFYLCFSNKSFGMRQAFLLI